MFSDNMGLRLYGIATYLIIYTLNKYKQQIKPRLLENACVPDFFYAIISANNMYETI